MKEACKLTEEEAVPLFANSSEKEAEASEADVKKIDEDSSVFLISRRLKYISHTRGWLGWRGRADSRWMLV